MPANRGYGKTDPPGVEEVFAAQIGRLRERITEFNNAVGCDSYAPEVESAALIAAKLSDAFGNLAEDMHAAVNWAEDKSDADGSFADTVIPKTWKRRAA